MIQFMNDYSESAAPEILQALSATAGQQYAPYGEDILCAEAKKLICYEVQRENIDVHFVSGGTQANLTVIDGALRSHEGVLATNSGHIATFETGAIEATGHKVITVPHHDGKLTVCEIEEVLAFHCDEHLVKPGMLYISQSTEWGSIYSLAELEALSALAHDHGLLLYVDGARMGAALTAENADFTLADMASLVDVFTIGGTKNGALYGEAIVVTNEVLKADFRYLIKQKGALQAKGWLLGVQFKELFRDGLFYRLAEQSNLQAQKIEKVLRNFKVDMAVESPTNQLFPIMSLDVVMRLSENFTFHIVEKRGDDQAVIRLVTSWATTDTAITALEGELSAIFKSL